jgi:hypothetical protein
MSACEDLQSRIYNILELGGLRTLRKRYPDGAYAEEILTSLSAILYLLHGQLIIDGRTLYPGDYNRGER